MEALEKLTEYQVQKREDLIIHIAAIVLQILGDRLPFQSIWVRDNINDMCVMWYRTFISCHEVVRFIFHERQTEGNPQLKVTVLKFILFRLQRT